MKNSNKFFCGTLLISLLFGGFFCNKEEGQDPQQSKGVGPVTSVVLDATIQEDLVKKGKKLFEQKCASCHKFTEVYVGPALAGITKRRAPEWIMNMILAPEEMLEKDPLAQELLETYASRMVGLGLNQQEARAILEYFRKEDSTK